MQCSSVRGLGQSGSQRLDGHGSSFQVLDQLASVSLEPPCSPPSGSWSPWPLGIYMACLVEINQAIDLDII